MVQKYNFSVSNEADNDLLKSNTFKPKQFSEKLINKYENIERMPHMYQRIYYDEKTQTDYRRTVFNKYVIIYKIHKKEITILRIVSEKTDYLQSIKNQIQNSYI